MKTNTRDLSLAWLVTLAFLVVTTALTAPDFAIAANTPMGNVMCTVVNWFTGNTGKGLATLAITVIGIGALLGKVSWGMAIVVGIGIAVVFGAASLVNALGAGGGSTTACTTT